MAEIRRITGNAAGSLRRRVAGLGCAVAACLAVALEYGFGEPVLSVLVLEIVQLVLGFAALVLSRDVLLGGSRLVRIPKWFGRVALLALLAGVVLELVGVFIGLETATVALTLALAVRLNSQLARTMSNPALLFPGSFLLLILVAMLLLKLPAATPEEMPIGWIDALFTATSAVCVTGLAVRETASGFTGFGQLVVLLAIQLGGLGAMIFGSTLALLFGARLSHKENLTLSAALSEYPAHRINRFIRFIVLTTLGLQAIGAVLIYVSAPDLDQVTGERAWHAIFHSVSAFCNAGFDLTGASMVPMRGSFTPYVALMPLIILGGLGFMVLEDLWPRAIGRARRKGQGRRLATHTRLVLATTAVLLVGGAVLIFVSQLGHGSVGFGQRLLDAVYMSTTARTAGFTTMPMDELGPGSRFTLMVLMLVGGSPGSTAGGMKTVVVAMLVLAVVSTVRGRDEVEVFGRALPDALVKRAATVAFAVFTVIGVATLALGMSEGLRFELIFFEVISAATTTGLSLGITEDLSPFGRCVLIATMFLGRVGPLALVASLVAGGGSQASYRYPRDSVSLG